MMEHVRKALFWLFSFCKTKPLYIMQLSRLVIYKLIPPVANHGQGIYECVIHLRGYPFLNEPCEITYSARACGLGSGGKPTTLL